MIESYWRDDHSVPFATMLRIIDTYCHPEAYDEAYDDLIALARDPEPTDKMIRFKEELRQALSGNTEGLRPDAISTASQHADGTDEGFLRRLWSELYPEEPVPQAPAG